MAIKPPPSSLLCLLVAPLSLNLGCSAPPLQVGKMGLSVNGGPGLGGSDASAPSGIQAGTRISYWSLGGRIAGRGYNWQPTEQGGWVDPTTGQHYSPEMKEGTGSSTIIEYTVVGMDDKQAIVSQVNYVNRQGASKYINRSLVVGPKSMPGGLWSTPALLAGLSPSSDPKFRVSRIKWNLNGKEVDAVMTSSPSGQGSQFFVYELATGLMLRYGSAGVVGSNGVAAPGEENTPSVDTLQNALLGTRQMPMPWAGDPDPACAASFHEMDFEGQSKTTTGGGRVFTAQLSVKYTLGAMGKGWVACDVSRTQGGIVPGVTPITQQSKMATGSVSPNPLWINPSTLAKLEVGQVLDTDPYTKVVTKVGEKTNGPKGPMITIVMDGGLDASSFGYDMQTGMLVSMHSIDKEFGTEDILSLQSNS